MTISAKACLVLTTSEFLFIFSALFAWLIIVSSFGITVLESREIDLYSDYTKIILQELTLAAITSVWISLQSWDLAYSVHHGLADQPRYGFFPAITYV